MLRTLVSSCVLLGLATVALAQHHGQMHQAALEFELAADSLVLPMQIVDGRIYVDTMLDGAGPFRFIFDTGAQGSVMDLTFAREQKLPLGQPIQVGSPGGPGRPGNLVTIEQLAIGALVCKNVPLVAFDGLPFPRTENSPRGVLSPYGLSGLLITLDYPGQRLVFRRGALPEPDGQEVFGWASRNVLPEIPGTVAGQPITMHLDSGASLGLSLPTAFASQLELAGPLIDMGFVKAVDHARSVRGGQLRGDFRIGRYTLENPTLRFMDVTKGVANVGSAILSQFAITLDPANARLRLAGPADGRLEVHETHKPRYGMQLNAVEESPIQVLMVDEKSPAEKIGLRAGDRIVRINGRAVTELSVLERVDALTKSPLQLTVERSGEALELEMVLE